MPLRYSTGRFAAPALLVILAAVVAGQNRPSGTTILVLPNGPVMRLASPDNNQVLYAVPFRQGENQSPQLWIEDHRTGERKKLLDVAGTLRAFWSPDGHAFAVEDHMASDTAKAYFYDAATLVRTDLGEQILAADPEVRRFARGHAYFAPQRWVDPQRVIVRFHGHTEHPPVVCFDFSYHVDRSGSVLKLAQKILPVTDSGCAAGPSQ